MPGTSRITLLAQAGNHFIAWNKLDLTAFDVIVSSVKCSSQLGHLVEIARHHVLHQLVCGASGFRCPSVYLGLEVGVVKVHCHVLTLGSHRDRVKKAEGNPVPRGSAPSNSTVFRFRAGAGSGRMP